MAAFASDVRLPDAEREALRRRASSAITAETVWLWDDDGPVSLAALQGPTPRGVRVSMVYTPEARRRRGYASAGVAALSAHALAAGRQFCTLYTDLANPTSNALYQRIGYEPVTDAVMIRFASA